MKSIARKLGAGLFLSTLWLAYSGCSSDSDSSSTGAGFIVTGNYQGTFNGSNSTNGRNYQTRFNISLNQIIEPSDGDDSSGQIGDISGTFVYAGGDQCWNGGSITGTSNGSNVDLEFSPTNNEADTVNNIIVVGQQRSANEINGNFSANTSRICGAISGTFTMQK